MIKSIVLLAIVLVAAWANAQTNLVSHRYLLEPTRLSYEAPKTLGLASLDMWNFKKRPDPYALRQPMTMDLFFYSRNDPFRTWQGRRVGYREAIGAEVRSKNSCFEWSTGSTSEGRMSNVGFEIRW